VKSSKLTPESAAVAIEAFSAATAIRARTAEIFDAEVSEEWTAVAGRPGGGYLLAIVGRAASALGSGTVIAASAHYLSSPRPGPVEVAAELLRRGRHIGQVRARLSQDGRPCLEALMSIGELDPSAVPRWDRGAPDYQPVPLEECIRLAPVTPDGRRAAVFDQVRACLDPESAGLLRGHPSGRGQVRGWLALPGQESFDPVSLLYAVDALPPPTLDTEFNAMVATITLTAYTRAVPAPGPVWISSYARLIDQQCADQICDVWDATGRLVAHATQLSLVPPGSAART
jgi:hypothetical protein